MKKNYLVVLGLVLVVILGVYLMFVSKNVIEKKPEGTRQNIISSPSPIVITQENRTNFFQKQTEAEYAKLFGFNLAPKVFDDPILGKRYVWLDGARNLNINNVEIAYLNEGAKPGKIVSAAESEKVARGFLKDRKLDDSGLVLGSDMKYLQIQGSSSSEVQKPEDATIIVFNFNDKTSGKLKSTFYVSGLGEVRKMTYIF